MKSGCDILSPSFCQDPVSSYGFERLFNFSHSARATEFPPPPFLVSSVLEALRKHVHYAQKTWLVPEEADTFCAGYASAHGAAILTADSDALAYDLGKDGSVMLLKDIEIREEDYGIKTTQLDAKIYRLGTIAKRFGLKSLTPLAYAVSRDRHKSLGRNLEIARQAEKEFPRDYKSFTEEYELTHFDSNTSSNATELQLLSPIFAEWYFHSKGVGTTLKDSHNLEIWLPLLAEDASRTAPWNYGTYTRCLAYSVLSPRSVTNVNTFEHMRKGMGATQVEVRHLGSSELFEKLNEAYQYLTNSVTTLSKNTKRPTWRDLGLLWLCRCLAEDEKTIPDRSTLELIFTGNVYHRWDLVHLRAQFQAILSSWRFLFYSLNIYVSLCTDVENDMISESARDLLRLINVVDGASWSNMFDPLKTDIDHGRLDFVIQRIFDELGVQENVKTPQADLESHTSNEPKREPKRKKIKEPLIKASPKPTNMYDILAGIDE
jgi:XPG family protein